VAFPSRRSRPLASLRACRETRSAQAKGYGGHIALDGCAATANSASRLPIRRFAQVDYVTSATERLGLGERFDGNPAKFAWTVLASASSPDLLGLVERARLSTNETLRVRLVREC
jgi:hypothetical protein